MMLIIFKIFILIQLCELPTLIKQASLIEEETSNDDIAGYGRPKVYFNAVSTDRTCCGTHTKSTRKRCPKINKTKPA